MAFSHGDPIELLLPGVDQGDQVVARKVTTFMRLLVQDASSESTTLVVPNPGRASQELQRHVNERAVSALEAILGCALARLLGPDSFAWFGRRELDEGEAWALLSAMFPDAFPRALPRAGEGLVALVERSLEIAAAIGMGSTRIAQWRARLIWASAGASAALPGLQKCLQTVRSDRTPEATWECRIDLAAAELDRGHPRAAAELLADAPAHGDLAHRSRALIDWAALLVSRHKPVAGPRKGEVTLPRPLVELRSERPDWLPALSGKGAEVDPLASDDHGQGSSWELGREALGATAMVVFARRGSGFSPIDASCDPDQASRLSGWLRALDGCWRIEAHPAHTLVLSGRPVVVRAALRPGDEQGRLEIPAEVGALSPAALGVALTPVSDPAGVVVGWVYLEFAHHLIPSRPRLAAIGRGFARRVAEARRPLGGARSSAILVPRAPLSDARAAPFLELIERLGVKTAHRRWWGFVNEGGKLVTVAGGGNGLGEPESGGAQGLERVLDAQGCFHFSEPDVNASIHARAGSGWAVPLVHAGRVVGILALESERRIDFRPEDVQRVSGLARATALGVALACFAQHHLDRHGEDICFDISSPGFVAFAQRLEPLRGTRHAIELVGPAGCGKATMAYWLHRAVAQGSELERLRATDLGVDGLRAWGSVPASNVLLTDIDRLDSASQEVLFGVLERRARLADGPTRAELGRWILTRRTADSEAGTRARLSPALATALGRLQISLPGLAQRRADVPQLARFLARSLARREGIEAPRLSDGTCGLLWRQPWPENVRDLSRVLHRWVLAFPGRKIHREEAIGTWSPTLPEPVLRLAPRSVSSADLRCALFTTRTASDRVNKTRAAAYLGWDPDTLANHMSASGLAPSSADPVYWDCGS